MTVHSIVGAGQIGTRLASLLAARGDEVRLISRHGTEVPGSRSFAADASDPVSLQKALTGSTVVYNCVNPPYHRWATDWPPIAENLIACAQREGAVLVTLSNLYGYGPVDGPITEQTPLIGYGRKGQVRTWMWEQALGAHEAGRIRTVEVRASDYIGEGGAQVTFGSRVLPRLRAGKPLRLLGRTDQPHTWTYTGDVATTLAAVAMDESAWGRAWHVPSNEPRTQAQVIADLATVIGVPVPPLKSLGRGTLRAVGVFNPAARELVEMLYEFERPFVMDSSAAQRDLGLKPTPWTEVVEQTLLRNP